MIFSIRNLGFELGSLLLEGWAAFAARVVCAALLLVLGWLARQLLSRRVCPALLRRSWRLAGTPILLRSFAVPVQRLTLAAFIYAAAASLPWAIPGVSKFLLTVFELAATFLCVRDCTPPPTLPTFCWQTAARRYAPTAP